VSSAARMQSSRAGVRGNDERRRAARCRLPSSRLDWKGDAPAPAQDSGWLAMSLAMKRHCHRCGCCPTSIWARNPNTANKARYAANCYRLAHKPPRADPQSATVLVGRNDPKNLARVADSLTAVAQPYRGQLPTPAGSCPMRRCRSPCTSITGCIDSHSRPRPQNPTLEAQR
jgi:hypothetical protein